MANKIEKKKQTNIPINHVQHNQKVKKPFDQHEKETLFLNR